MKDERKKKDKKEEIEWDRKRIFLFLIGLVVILAIIIELKSSIIGGSYQAPSRDVRGESSVNYPPPPDIKGSIQNQINNLKQEAQNINVTDIATSSPQVKKVINDLKALQEYPNNQIKSSCEQICNGL